MSEKRILKIKELDPDMIAPSTATFNKPSQGGSKIVIIGKPGCFRAGTPVLMYDGSIKKVEDVNVGDLVMGDDSRPRTVLQLCRDNELMYEIKPEFGESYIVNENHKLVLLYNSSIFEIKVKNYIKLQDKNSYKIYKSSVAFPEKKLNDLIITDSMEYIPNIYKINSRNNRLKVLGEIIEKMGNYNNNWISVSTSFELFANDIIFIARSLGFNSYKISCQDKYIVKINGYLKSIPCEKCKNINCKVLPLSYNFVVNELNKEQYYGFTIDGNHRFLLGSFDVVRNTGKTTLISSLLYEKSHIYPSGLIFSGTEDSNHHYSQIFPSTFVYNKYDKEKIKDYIKRQKIAKQHLDNPWSVLLLDDCTDDPKIFNDPLFQGIFKNGRHWKMWFILSLQYCLDVKPVIRTNIDGTFILRETNLRNRKALWENYAGVIPDFTDFCDIMDQLTNDYTALYIHNSTTSNKIEDCIFWYKARPIPPDFRFGSDDFWGFHKKRYNSNYIDPVVI